MPVTMPTPDGTGSDVHVPPASAVAMMTGVPKMPNPAAMQSDVVVHEIALRPATSDGMGRGAHAYPAFAETRTEFTPTAKQSAVLGHETEFK
jgi:hypothetical protein